MFFRNHLGWVFLVIAAILVTSVSAVAAPPVTDPNQIIRIEQDWRIELYTTDAVSGSPQIISGFPIPGSLNLFQVTWNHRDYAGFVPGGFELQAWQDQTLTDGYYMDAPPFSSPNEVINITKIVDITSHPSTGVTHWMGLSVLNSQSWGTLFGPNMVVLWTTIPGDTTDLATYTPEMSVQESAVLTGAERVKWFGILETRYYNSQLQLMNVDSTPRVIVQN